MRRTPRGAPAHRRTSTRPPPRPAPTRTARDNGAPPMPSLSRRVPRRRLPTTAGGRAGLARREPLPGPRVGAPQPPTQHPRPHPTVLARAAAHPHRRDPHLPPPAHYRGQRAGPDAPCYSPTTDATSAQHCTLTRGHKSFLAALDFRTAQVLGVHPTPGQRVAARRRAADGSMVSELVAQGLRVRGPDQWLVVAAAGGRASLPSRVFGIDVMLIFFDTFTAVGTYVQRGL